MGPQELGRSVGDRRYGRWGGVGRSHGTEGGGFGGLGRELAWWGQILAGRAWTDACRPCCDTRVVVGYVVDGVEESFLVVFEL